MWTRKNTVWCLEPLHELDSVYVWFGAAKQVSSHPILALARQVNKTCIRGTRAYGLNVCMTAFKRQMSLHIPAGITPNSTTNLRSGVKAVCAHCLSVCDVATKKQKNAFWKDFVWMARLYQNERSRSWVNSVPPQQSNSLCGSLQKDEDRKCLQMYRITLGYPQLADTPETDI